MSCRTVELAVAPGVLRIRHVAPSGPECILRAALLRWDGSGDRAPGVLLVGAAWQGPGHTVFWGWPDESGRIELRPGPDRPGPCGILPPALSLALAFRRRGVDFGAQALVIGDGFLSHTAHAVASMVGLRVEKREDGAENEASLPAGPEVVIETSGDPRNLDRALELCRNWGSVFSFGGALSAGPLEYYRNLHRRALTLTHVPERPVLRRGEEEIPERSVTRLTEALRGISPAQDEILHAQILPEDVPGRLTRERSGWGLLLAGEQ